jgi:protein SCO1/2
MFRSSLFRLRMVRRGFFAWRHLPIILAVAVMGLPACHWARAQLFEQVLATSGQTDCLPNVTLTDQYGKPVSLASLKGKPVLVDFVYTSCATACLVMTSQMVRIADRLGPEIGSKVTLVSITTDPEHDRPAQLLYYARHENADRSGWLFLTGTPKQIDAELANFHVTRQRYTDGSIGHVTDFFLLGPNGHERLIFDPMQVTPDDVAAHVEQAEAPG